jgi:hypothetical protein
MIPAVRVLPSSGPYPSQGDPKYITTPELMSLSFTAGQRQTLFEVVLLVRYLPVSRILNHHMPVMVGQVPVFNGSRYSRLSLAYNEMAMAICLLLFQ